MGDSTHSSSHNGRRPSDSTSHSHETLSDVPEHDEHWFQQQFKTFNVGEINSYKLHFNFKKPSDVAKKARELARECGAVGTRSKSKRGVHDDDKDHHGHRGHDGITINNNPDINVAGRDAIQGGEGDQSVYKPDHPHHHLFPFGHHHPPPPYHPGHPGMPGYMPGHPGMPGYMPGGGPGMGMGGGPGMGMGMGGGPGMGMGGGPGMFGGGHHPHGGHGPLGPAPGDGGDPGDPNNPADPPPGGDGGDAERADASAGGGGGHSKGGRWCLWVGGGAGALIGCFLPFPMYFQWNKNPSSFDPWVVSKRPNYLVFFGVLISQS